MKPFCSDCGHTTTRATPPGDDKERDVCSACGAIQYENPKLVAGCIITHKGKVMLCRRAIEPEKDKWTLPAGYMELGETVEEAAMREAWEECRARVISQGLYQLWSLPQYDQVYMLFRGELTGFHVGNAGLESIGVGLFAETEIPWDGLAFGALTRPALQMLLSDSVNDSYPVRSLNLAE